LKNNKYLYLHIFRQPDVSREGLKFYQ